MLRLPRSALALVCVAVLACCYCGVASAADPTVLYVSNPFMVGAGGTYVAADPDVLKVTEGPNAPYYVMTHTQKNSGGSDFPIYVSTDLVNWELRGQAFGVTLPANPETSVQLGDMFYCGCWAPEIRPAGKRGGYVLTFTASRFNESQEFCPGYDEGSGLFAAYSDSPMGPFDVPTAGGHPQAVGPSTDPAVCPPSVLASLPLTLPVNQPDCGDRACNNTMRLDGDLFNDPQTGESWMAYAWYSNALPLTEWDRSNLGEHVSLVKVEATDPRVVPCDAQQATKVWAFSPHDNITEQQLGSACPRCGEKLSFVRGRDDQVVYRDGAVWGVTEGPMLFRRGGYVYLIVAHSIWDSSYYSAAWVAAPTVEELDITNGPSPRRLEGRLLIPSRDQSFGHGTAVEGPDGIHWYFVHHHLNHSNCRLSTDVCARDLYVTPIIFDDRGDGRGDVWIREQFPAEQNQIPVYQPTGPSPAHGDDDSSLRKLSHVSLGLGLAIVGLVLLAGVYYKLRERKQAELVQHLLPYAEMPNSEAEARDAALLQQQYNAGVGQ